MVTDNFNNIFFKEFSIDDLDFNVDLEYEVIRNKTFSLTHYATSNFSNTLCFVENEAYLWKANRNEKINLIITTKKFSDEVKNNKGLIITENPRKLFFEIHNSLKEHYSYEGEKNIIDPTSKIHPTAVIGDGVFIGKRTKIGAFSVVEDGSVIGSDVIIGNHVTVGARGMHNTKVDGSFISVVDLGNVVIEDDCEILSQAVIQKPYFYHSTVIGKQTRVSVSCNIGHGCLIGPRCLIAGHSIISGYCTIGKDVWIGPNSTISHAKTIEDYSSVILGSVVVKNLQKGETVSGNFAYEHVKNLTRYLKYKRD